MTPESQRMPSGYFEQKNVVVNPKVDHILGLDKPSMQPHIHKFRNGMSGAATIHVEELGQVVKWNEDKQKIYGEARGYELLQETSLAPYLLAVDTTHIEDGIIATPYYDGQQLREGVKNESIDPESAVEALSTLLSVKREWWASQDPQEIDQEGLISMQREEWEDTVSRIQALLPAVAEHYKMTPEQLLLNNLVLNGKELPTLATILESSKSFLTGKPNRTVLAHNDATGANVLIKPEIGEIKIIDYQWTGKPSDPAEAFVRMGKWASTSMLSQTPAYKVLSVNGAVHLESQNTPVNPLAQQMQEVAEAAIPSFARAMGEPEFGFRVQSYMAGSYLRELALSAQRGGPESSMFAIIKAGESLVKGQ